MNLPVSFIDYTRALLGNEEYEKLFAALEQEPPVSIRLNKLTIDSGQLTVTMQADSVANSQLLTFNSQLKQVPWCEEGYYLDQRLTFTFDPLFHAGCYYVQEASSMFVGQVLQQYLSEEPVVMLDLCAAPGGKSTHACSLLPAGSLLVANEVIRNRSQILAENLTKWGYPGVVVTNNDPADFSRLGGFFDVILTDVPCSGVCSEKIPAQLKSGVRITLKYVGNVNAVLLLISGNVLNRVVYLYTVLVLITRRRTKKMYGGFVMSLGQKYFRWISLRNGTSQETC